jgi:lipid A 4'-phosphatase
MYIKKPQILFISISTFIAIIFLAFPQIDLFVSGLFYNNEQKFFLKENPILVFLHDSVRYIVIAISLGLVGGFALNSFEHWKKLKCHPRLEWGSRSSFMRSPYNFSLKNSGDDSLMKCYTNRHLIYLILCLAIGPGLVVNTIFKDNWGRARPFQTENFGGDKTFTLPFIIAGQCEKNCSFTSGDPSVGFYFFAFAFAFPKKRKEFFGLAMSLGVIFGGTRILQGAHFFSDVIFSGIFVYAVCYLLYKIMFQKEPTEATKD